MTPSTPDGAPPPDFHSEPQPEPQAQSLIEVAIEIVWRYLVLTCLFFVPAAASLCVLRALYWFWGVLFA